jgi:hypothetical protein
MKTIQIELTDEQVAQIAKIMSTRKDRSQKEIVDLVVERGIYTLLYRTHYNVVKYTREKAMREEFKAFKAARKESGALVGGNQVVAAKAPTK